MKNATKTQATFLLLFWLLYLCFCFLHFVSLVVLCCCVCFALCLLFACFVAFSCAFVLLLFIVFVSHKSLFDGWSCLAGVAQRKYILFITCFVVCIDIEQAVPSRAKSRNSESLGCAIFASSAMCLAHRHARGCESQPAPGLRGRHLAQSWHHMAPRA